MDLSEKRKGLIMEIDLGIWENNKKKSRYMVTGLRLNTTNDRDEEILVAYESLEDTPRYFCREIKEFKQHFTLIFGERTCQISLH